MAKVSVFYPYAEGKKFDIAYYVGKHMPVVRRALGAACKGLAVEHGVGGAAACRRTLRWDTCCSIQRRLFEPRGPGMPKRLWEMFRTTRRYSRSCR